MGLGVAGGVEPGVLAVEDEDLAGGLGVAPAHAAGLLEEEGALFGAVHAHAGVVLLVVGGEAGQVVVVVVYFVEDGFVLGEEGRAEEEDCGSTPLPPRFCVKYSIDVI